MLTIFIFKEVKNSTCLLQHSQRKLKQHKVVIFFLGKKMLNYSFSNLSNEKTIKFKHNNLA